jgi:hypothetical protein
MHFPWPSQYLNLEIWWAVDLRQWTAVMMYFSYLPVTTAQDPRKIASSAPLL